MPEHARAACGMAATALIWSTGGLAIKLTALSPMAAAGGRSLLAALTLWALFRGRLDFRPSRSRIVAALGYAGMLVTNVAATKLTTAANAILLAYTAPVYVALLAPTVLGERTRRADWFLVGVVLAGMVLFFLDGLTPSGMWGNALAAVTGLSYAVFTLAMRAGREDGTAATVSAVIVGHGLAALAGLPFLLADPPSTAGDWWGLAYLGIVQQGLSLVLYAWCIRRLRALAAICILTLEPICNPVFVALGYGELPGTWAVAGGIVVIGAVTLWGVLGERTRRAG